MRCNDKYHSAVECGEETAKSWLRYGNKNERLAAEKFLVELWNTAKHKKVVSITNASPAPSLGPKRGANKPPRHTLCLAFGRATKGISYAVPTYHADHLCDRGRCYLKEWSNNGGEFEKPLKLNDMGES